jgi:hypothetical protein
MTNKTTTNSHIDYETLLSDRAHLARIIASMYNWKDKSIEDIISAFPKETND